MHNSHTHSRLSVRFYSTCILLMSLFSVTSIFSQVQVYSGFIQATFKDLIWLKGGYQSTQNIYSMIGVNTDKVRIDYRLTKLNNKKITSSNKEAVLKEVKELKLLMQNSAINESSTEAAEEAGQMIGYFGEKGTDRLSDTELDFLNRQVYVEVK